MASLIQDSPSGNKRLLLSGDDFLYTDGTSYYVKNPQSANLFARYLRVFSSIRIAYRVGVLETAPPGYYRLDCTRMEVVDIPMFHRPKQFLLRGRPIFKALNKVHEGCDVAILRIPSVTAFATWFRIRRKMPYAVEVVYDFYDDYRTASGFGKVLSYLMYRLQVWVCHGAVGVSCVTEHYLQQRYFSKRKDAFTAFYSTLSLGKDRFTSPRAFPGHQPFRLIHVANHVIYKGVKGHYELLHALRILRDKGLDCMVDFVGNDYGNGIARLTDTARRLGVVERVCFRGYLSREGLFNALKDADIFVFPTKVEGLPRVLIEAMATGLPCVSTDASGIPELLPGDVLCSYDDVEGMARIVERLMTTPQDYEKASRMNYDKSLEYEASILEKRRDVFYRKLSRSIFLKHNH